MNEDEVLNDEVVSGESDNVDNVQADENSQYDNETLTEIKSVLQDMRNEQSNEANSIVSVTDEQYQSYLKVEAANQVCLVVIVALLVILIGMKFGSILTRYWNNK